LALIVAMALTMALIVLFAYLGERREAAAALEDYTAEQATLARALSVKLKTHLLVAQRDALLAADDASAGRVTSPRIAESYLVVRVRDAAEPATQPALDFLTYRVTVPVAQNRRVDLLMTPGTLLAGMAELERPDARLVLLRPPGGRTLRAADGRTVSCDPIVAAFDQETTSLRLTPDQAVRLGLPRRTAIAGLAWVDAGPLGRWGIAAVASARRQRDRERRGRWRLLVSVLMTGGTVLLFGGIALRRQRKALELERQLAVSELERTRDDTLERADRAATLGTFAMGIAHEISTPLAVIAGRAEQLATRVGEDERTSRAVNAILEQTAQIHEVIRAFLRLVRDDSPSTQPVDPAAIVRGATALVEHRFHQAGVALAVDGLGRMPSLHGDPRLLEHALVNLLLNACDACQRGGNVELSVSNGRSIAFVVSDDGAGISPHDAARLTEPFFTTKPSGTGLGLAIVNEIVKHHGGKLELMARVPRGTIARMELPVGERSSP
jgi:two-component system, NtrC family, sensor kinase